MSDAKIGIIMGSQSDWPTMKHAADILDELAVPHECKIVSAHRTPDRMYDYARAAKAHGLKVIIAGAGGAAHLPGMTAARRAGAVESFVGTRFIAVHRANAGRCTGRHFGHWRGRRQKCSALGRRHCRQ